MNSIYRRYFKAPFRADRSGYAPRLSNDRLLLGLKGSLNEYELDLLRQHSVEARREKARRGELLQAPPVGYIKTEDQGPGKKSGPAGATGYPSCLPQVHGVGHGAELQ
jgi:hypothetical protein